MADWIKAASIRFFAVATVALAGLFFSAAPAFAGVPDNVVGWAWSGSIGWISMNCTNTSTCAAVDYGVTIVDTPGFNDRADLEGWAWSENVGWICFGMTCSGTTPEGDAPFAQYRSTFNGKTDQFWGWAQVVSMGTNGWISLNCDKVDNALIPDECATSNYFLKIDGVTGVFTSGAANDHWAWGYNSDGQGIGWIDFDSTYPNVSTGWVHSDLGTIKRPQGVFESNASVSANACATDADCASRPPYTQCTKYYPVGGASCTSNTDCTPQTPYSRCDLSNGTCYKTDKCTLPGTHRPSLTVNFSNFWSGSGELLECELLLPDGSLREVDTTIPSRTVNSNYSLSYTVQPADNIQQNSIWYINACRLASAQTMAAPASCTTSAQCGATAMCDLSINKCRQVVQNSTNRRPIYTHGNSWTGLNASQDEYLAIKCNSGFPGEYFKNAAQCEYTGDASFALAMRRGIPVEGNCSDGIDNDGNGEIDCADRYCQGVSYRCQTLSRTSCIYGQTGDGINDCSDPTYQSGSLCCSQQPKSAGATVNNVVDGLECIHGDPNDGYFDCDCTGSAIGTYADCYAPGYQAGDLCCSTANVVEKH